MKKVQVLLVEDNQDMSKAVTDYLSDNGYIVNAFSSSEEALDSPHCEQCDIAILDIALPGMSGLELTTTLKKQGFDGPIIGLTARDAVDDKVAGLSLGMDDYVVKPFDLRELGQRVNAQLRSFGLHHELAAITTLSYKIDPKQHKFFIKNQPANLTLVEFRLMLCLMQQPYIAVTSQDLIEAAWGDSSDLINPPLRIHISNLRTKIGDTNLTIIHTIPGIGYMLQD